MERIVYRKTLDVHKNGIQFTLQGFETADNMARRIEISLMASGDTIDLPLEQMSAIMYVTTPKATEPSINECTIKDNTIICDVMPIVEAGITEMQLKLIETRPEGANGVLPTPKFAIEVSESNMNDESATQTTTYTALENALAMAKAVYDTRIERVEIDKDCMFRVIYADGSMYETDVLNETLLKGEAILSQSYARGGTGTRTGEDTDNSMYYSNVSRSASKVAQRVMENSEKILEEVKKHGVYTAFSLDFETGELEYISPLYSFEINKNTGKLDVEGDAYTPDETIDKTVTEWLESKSTEIQELRESLHFILPQCLNRAYPVGSIYVANNPDIKPSNLFGGNWKLIDKKFHRARIHISDEATLKKYIVHDDDRLGTNVNVSSLSIDYSGHSITVTVNSQLALTIPADMSDSSFKLLYFIIRDAGFDDSLWGVHSTKGSNGEYENIIYPRYIPCFNDSNDSLCMLKVGPDSEGMVEVRYDTKIPSDSNLTQGSDMNFTVTMDFLPKNMKDAFCDKFYWQRTS